MLAVGVAEWGALTLGFERVTSGTLVGGESVPQPEVGLEVPEGVFVNLTALASVQGEGGVGGVADLLGDVVRTSEDFLFGRW